MAVFEKRSERVQRGCVCVCVWCEKIDETQQHTNTFLLNNSGFILIQCTRDCAFIHSNFMQF